MNRYLQIFSKMIYFTLVRLDESRIPLGDHKLIPSATSNRLMHLPLRAFEANIQLHKDLEFKSYKNLNKVVIRYETLPKTLNIYYEASFPHKIFGWEEIINEKKNNCGFLKKVFS